MIYTEVLMTIDIRRSLCYYKNVMNAHPNVPMVQNQEKSELEKFTLFYEHTPDTRPKTRQTNGK